MTDDIPAGFEPIDLERQDIVSFERHIGPLYQRADEPEGKACWGFRAAAHHCNPYGMLHGGMLTSVADTMMGSLVFHALEGKPCATISLTSDFIGAAKAGDWIEGRAEVLRMGRAVCFLRAEMRAGERLLMSASGAWAIIQPR